MVIKSIRMRLLGHTAHMEDATNAYKILVRKPEGERALGRTKCRWEEHIKLHFVEIRCENVDWILRPHDSVQWRALLKGIIKL
jgi:hypothetical protein